MRGNGSGGSKERELEGDVEGDFEGDVDGDVEGDVEEHNEGGGGVGAKR